MRTLSLGVLAHIDAGKTSTTERILFEAGAIPEMGRVDAGNTVTDTLEQERLRGITIQSAVTAFRMDDLVVSLVDTPGHPDFIAEIERVLDILDGAILIVSAVEGVQAQTRILFRALKRCGIPLLIFVNKIDRVGACSDGLLDQIRLRLTPSVVPLGLPTELGSQAASYIPFQSVPDESRQDVIAILAEADEQMLELFVEHPEAIDDRTIFASLRRQTQLGAVHPVLFGSAITGAGVDELMAAIAEYLPRTNLEAGRELSGTVFKIERERTGEKVAYARIFSGSLDARRRVLVGGIEQRVNALAVFEDSTAVPTSSVGAGRIAKVWGFARAKIGDAIGTQATAARGGYFAPPFLESAVRPNNPQERGRLHRALSQLAEQDPLIRLRQDDHAQALFVSLFGEVQKEVIRETLRTEFQIGVEFSPSIVVHIERLVGVGRALEEAPEPFIATVGLRLEPGPVGSGNTFSLEINPGDLPASFYKAVEDAAMTTLRQGLYGWEVVDCSVIMTRGTLHRDWATSTAADHRKVAPLVVADALRRAGTEVHEPIQAFHLECPEESLGEVVTAILALGELSTEPAVRSGTCVIEGSIPAAHLPELQGAIPRLTRGEGFVETDFGHFARVQAEFPVRPRFGINPFNRGEYLRATGGKLAD